MYGDLKLTFIQKCTAEYMQSVIAAIKARASKLNVGVTNEGVNSLAYQVIAQNAGSKADLMFKEYLRMVDMGVGKSHPLGGLTVNKAVLQLSKNSGANIVKDNVRKPKKIYSKTAYGKLNYLIGKLSYGFTEETIALLKQNLTNNGNNIN